MNRKTPQFTLFKSFPELADNIARIPLGAFPTPVQQLKHMGCKNLWIKRDDMSSQVYGGNKLRKLEFILGDVKRKNKKRVITFGGIGTNHGLATAIFCNQLDIDCSLLLFWQPVTRNVKQNLRLFYQYNATLVYRKSIWSAILSYLIFQRITHPFDYFLYAGGSTIYGTLGFVNAAFELKEQIDKGDMPEPEYLFCPVGSSGTMAGLVLGTLLAGLNTTVIGVGVTMRQVGPVHVCTGKTVKTMAEKTYRFLKKMSDHIPDISIYTPEVIGEYLGDGYGHPTEKGSNAFHGMKEKENIILDPCYTSKAFAAVLDHCRKKPDNSRPVLFWHTYNSVDLSAQADSVNVDKFPKKLQSLLNGDEVVY